MGCLVFLLSGKRHIFGGGDAAADEALSLCVRVMRLDLIVVTFEVDRYDELGWAGELVRGRSDR